MSDDYDLPERLNEQSRLWAENPSITVEYKFDIPNELIEEIEAKGFDDAPTRAAKLVAKRRFREQYNHDDNGIIGCPTITVEQDVTTPEEHTFRVVCVY